VKTFLLLLLSVSSYPAQVADSGSSTDWSNRGNVLFHAAHYREAELLFEKALAVASSRETPNPAQLAVLNINLAASFRVQAKYGEAEALYREALEYAQSEPPASSHAPGALRGLALVSLGQGRLADAEAFARRSLDGEIQSTDPGQFAESADTLAAILLARENLKEAEDSANRALAAFPKQDWHRHEVSALALNTLGRIGLAQGKNDVAEAYLSQAVQILHELLDYNSPTIAAVSVNLADARARRGDWESATSLLTDSITTLERVLGENQPEVASGLSILAGIHRARKQYRKAWPLYERALQIDERVVGPNALKTAVDLNNLGSLALARHRYDDSIELLTRAFAIEQRVRGANHPETGLVASNLAEAYFMRKRYGEAEPLLRQAIAVKESSAGAEDPGLVRLLSEYSDVLRAAGRFSEAEMAELRSTRIKVRNAIRSNS